MISHLKGIITAKGPASVTLDVNGVGYLVFATQHNLESLKESEAATLFTHMVVREDRFELYGFLHENELNFFQLLIKVRDVGPKTALAILSLGNLAEIQSAIIHGDVATLQSVPGIGRKTAERIILELKEKVFASLDDASPQRAKADGVVGALENLGYSSKEAKEAIRDMPKELATDDERLRWVLKNIGSRK